MPTRLISAQYSLSLRGHKLLYLAFSKIQPPDYVIAIPEIIITADEWQSAFIDSENPYRDLKHAVKSLLEEKVIFENGQIHHFLDKAIMKKGSGEVKLYFSQLFLRASIGIVTIIN